MPTAIAINCTLKQSADEPSSTDKMIELISSEFRKHSIDTAKTIRIADYNVKPGVSSDEGNGDEWPDIRKRILAADILIFGTPIWLGQCSSIAQRVLERMDAFLGETDSAGRLPSFNKIAVAAIVGNEDGAHRVTADLFQALNDLGWTIPAAGSCYWVGEAMQSIDFKDLAQPPEKIVQAAQMLAANTAHLSEMLSANAYPGVPQNAGLIATQGTNKLF